MSLSDWIKDVKKYYRQQPVHTATLYSARDLRAGMARRGAFSPIPGYNRAQKRLYKNRCVDVTDRDWDNLIILDACRYDYFKTENPFDELPEKIISHGSESWEYMEHNFDSKELHDTVYVTANPWMVKLSDNTFHHIEPLLEDWDAETGTILPKTVADTAIKTNGEYPNKKLIVHFMQPHVPWIGQTANKIRKNVNIRGMNPHHGHNMITNKNIDERDGINTFDAVKEGLISHKDMKQAYAETLRTALSIIEDLICDLNGKSVITSDHGEHLGEKAFPFSLRRYGHRQNTWSPELRCVPWLETETSERRTISSDPPTSSSTYDISDDVINKRLQALGYR